MMKEANFGTLLLLLLLAVTPRNSCATPIESFHGMMDGTPVRFPDPTVTGTTGGAPVRFPCPTVPCTTGGAPANMAILEVMEKGADILTAAMTGLQANVPRSSHFESILAVENQITNLPSVLSEHRPTILEGLYKSKDRFKELDTLLELAATTIMETFITLIGKLDKKYNNEDPMNLLKYSAGKFVEYAKRVNDILKSALQKTKEIQNLLTATSTFIIDFNAKQDYDKWEIEAVQEAAGDIRDWKTKLENQKQEPEILFKGNVQYTDKLLIPSCTYTPGSDCTIKVAITDLKKPALKSATALLSHVEDVKVYLEREINLITKWQISLEASILNNEDITHEDIQFNITGIKESLNNLKQACVDYLGPEKVLHENSNIFG